MKALRVVNEEFKGWWVNNNSYAPPPEGRTIGLITNPTVWTSEERQMGKYYINSKVKATGYFEAKVTDIVQELKEIGLEVEVLDYNS